MGVYEYGEQQENDKVLDKIKIRKSGPKAQQPAEDPRIAQTEQQLQQMQQQQQPETQQAEQQPAAQPPVTNIYNYYNTNVLGKVPKAKKPSKWNNLKPNHWFRHHKKSNPSSGCPRQ